MAKTKSINIKKEKKGKKLKVVGEENKKSTQKMTKSEHLHFEEPYSPESKNNLKKRKPKMPKVSNKKRKLKARKSLRKKVFIGVGILVIILTILSYFFVISPLQRIRDSLNFIRDTAGIIFTDIEQKDIRKLDGYIFDIRTEIQNIESELDRFSFLQTLSFTKGYYQNLEHISSAVEKTDVIIEENLSEMKRVLGTTGFVVDDDDIPTEEFNIDNSFETGTQEEATASTMILSELPRYLDFYERIEPDIYEILEELGKIDERYVPSVFGINLKDNVEGMKNFINDYPEISQQTLEFMRGVPELVGSNDGPTEYLIILQNEAEMRASGGLLTAFGHMTIKNGEFDGEISFSDMWNLENYVSYTLGIDTGNRNIYGQLYLMNQGCGSSYLRAQDAGIYPDLFWTAEKFTEYYDLANASNDELFPDYDHVIILNNAFAENLLSLIQPLEVEGYGEVTAESLFEFIKEETDDPALAFSPERKAIIEKISNAAKEKFVDLPLNEVPKIIRIIVDSINAKDIGFYSPENEMQEFFDKYSMSGRIIKDFEGDYFHFNEAQNCSLKLNNFVRNEITQDIYINDDGSIEKTVRANWEQPQIYEESLRLQYDPSGNFTYRAWVRIFTPEDSDNFDSDGLVKSGFLYYIPYDYYDEEMNKQVSENIIRFDHRRLEEEDPIPKQDLTVSYELPEYLNYEANGNYRMLIQKHPGKSWGEPYTINIHHNGQVHTILFTLNRDKVINYKDGIISIENYETSLDWLVDIAEGIPLDLLGE